MTRPNDDFNGPSLETYLETRLNLLTKSLEDKLDAADLRYQQRFEAQSKALEAAFQSQQQAMQTALAAAKEAVVAALAAADRAVQKAETAAEKRFEGVNEFRSALADQQRTLMPRAEVDIIVRGLTAKIDGASEALGGRITTTEKQLADRRAESLGIKGGYGNAAAVIGFILAVLGVLAYLAGRFG